MCYSFRWNSDLEGETPQEETRDVGPQKPNTLNITVQTSREKCTSQSIEDVFISVHMDLTQIK